jgi:hypothetical protein
MSITRDEHLKWCKERALEFVANNDCDQALASFISDLNKHDETRNLLEIVKQLTLPLKRMGLLQTQQQLREHIEGFI